jgi:hypothetical protein
MSTQAYRRDDDDVSADLTGSFLKQSDFSDGEDALLTIASVEKQHFDAKNGRPAIDKWVLKFDNEKSLGLNKTNLGLMAKWFGKRASAWVGQRIVVYRDESVSFGGQLVGGLRVRKPSARETASPDVAAFVNEL